MDTSKHIPWTDTDNRRRFAGQQVLSTLDKNAIFQRFKLLNKDHSETKLKHKPKDMSTKATKVSGFVISAPIELVIFLPPSYVVEREHGDNEDIFELAAIVSTYSDALCGNNSVQMLLPSATSKRRRGAGCAEGTHHWCAKDRDTTSMSLSYPMHLYPTYLSIASLRE
ncbi:hypothetical protein DFH09DRAFT_1280329 [Mycena vulgaris]|nr:hypothetical protein DFH09DRAFT_1280329 [Mycena vulgaris]